MSNATTTQATETPHAFGAGGCACRWHATGGPSFGECRDAVWTSGDPLYASGASAAVPDGTIARTICGVECVVCGYDVKPEETRVSTADGVFCSTSCARLR